jgi:hypothetical protein
MVSHERRFRDKADMRLKVTAPAGWTLVSDLPKSGDGYSSTQSSYWGTVAAGKYTTTNVKSEKAAISVDTLKSGSDVVTPMAEAVGKMCDFYTQKFGPPPSSNFRIVEVQGASWTSQWSVGMLLLPPPDCGKTDQDALAYWLLINGSLKMP